MEFNISNYLANMDYVNKDFNSIWEEIIDFVPKLTNNWRPGEANESDPLVVLLKELGIVEDKLNYNIDKNTLEQFPDLLTQLRTAYSVFKSMGYTPAWYRSAVAPVNIVYNGGVGDTLSSAINSGTEDVTVEANKAFAIPRFTQLSNDDFTQVYTLLDNVEFRTGVQSQKNTYAIEGTCNDFEVGGNTLITINNLDSQNRLYFVQPNVAQNGIFISSTGGFDDVFIEHIDGLGDSSIENANDNDNVDNTNTWKRVSNIYQYLPGNKIFKFGIDPSNGSNYIQFPDDIGELIGEGIYIKYILSSGSQGNITAGTLSTFVSDPTSDWMSPTAVSDPSNYNFTKDNFSINNSATQNGKDPETIEEMQKNYERVVGTFDTLVTLRDYENYIYTAEDSLGQHVVSNIRVSDRNNDLYRSYKYVTQDEKGVISRQTNSSRINYYDLKLYPLRSRGNINSYRDFEATFSYPKDTQNSSNTPWIRAITDVVEDAKVVTNNWFYDSDYGAQPFFVDYDLEGQVYLQKSVSNAEALEIKNNIDLAIYRAVNSRELKWGEPVNYPKLVDTIKGADSRIQYVALNPVDYRKKFENTAVDPVKLSILAGVTPWADFSTFRYFYGKNTVTTKGYIGSSDEPITNIQPQAKFHAVSEGGPGAANTYEVKANETLSILLPGYRTDATYSNYFYAVYGKLINGTIQKIWLQEADESTGKEGVVKCIPLNTPYTLLKDEVIYVYETREEAQKALETGSDTSYKITEGDVVSISGSGSTVKNGFPSGEAVNMGSKISISTIVPDENNIYNTNNPSPQQAVDANQDHSKVRILTNSKGLLEILLEGGAQSYTLDIGEYLLFSNYEGDGLAALEIGIVGEGNTITTPDSFSLSDSNLIGTPEGSSTKEKVINSALITSSLADLGTSDEINNLPGVWVLNNQLTCRVNTIYSFGEGYQLKIDGFSAGDAYESGVKSFGENVKEIQYRLGTDEFQSLPKLAEKDTYKYSYQLSLILAPGSYQELEEGQRISLISLNGKESTKESTIECTQESGSVVIQSNKSIVYSGGAGLTLTKEEGSGLEITSTTGADLADNGLNLGTEYFKALPAEGVFLPAGAEGIAAFIIPCVVKGSGANLVKYRIIPGSVTGNKIDFGDEVQSIGPAYAIKQVSEDTFRYYKVNDENDKERGWTDYTVPKAFFLGEGDGTEGHDNTLFLLLNNSSFCPIYQPSDSERIEKPEDPNSLFNPHHPLNRYVIPRLRGTENKSALGGLKVSTLSIRG